MDNLLLVTCVYPPEPVVSARLSYDIYHTIDEEGIEVKVLHPKPTRPNGYHFDNSKGYGLDEIVTDSFTCPESSLFGRFIESYSFGKTTGLYIKQHHKEIDVIYANTWPLFGQYYLARVANKYGIPYYMHIQDIYPESYSYKLPKIIGGVLRRILLPIDKYVLKNAEGVIVISPSMIPFLSESRGVDASKFTLVRNWQDDSTYIEAYKPIEKKADNCHIMYLGSINPTANVALIIKACEKIEPSQYSLSIIGNGPEKDNCIALAERLKVKALFYTVGPEQVAEMQGRADVLVLCLKKGVGKTATPSKLTAYMLSGRPIIASVDLDSDCANIIKEAGCGLVVEPDNEMALSKAIQELSKKSVEELNTFGKAAFDYAIAHLSKECNLSILINLITRKEVIEIKKAQKKDLPEIVAVHIKAFPNFFLTTLGEGFLNLYYKSVLKSPDGVLLIGQYEGETAGFCAGSLLSSGFNTRLLKNNLIGYACQGIKLLFTHPRRIWHLIKNLTKENVDVGDKGEYAELFSIGVDPTKQGGGVGKKMLLALEDEVSKNGGTKLSLTTDYENNEKAIEFYHSLGYKEWYDFVTYPNRRMYRMIKQLGK